MLRAASAWGCSSSRSWSAHTGAPWTSRPRHLPERPSPSACPAELNAPPALEGSAVQARLLLRGRGRGGGRRRRELGFGGRQPLPPASRVGVARIVAQELAVGAGGLGPAPLGVEAVGVRDG